MKMKNIKVMVSALAMLPTLAMAQIQPYFGSTPDLKVSGKEIVDPNGRPVSLHGVMDTPNDYFNGGRWNTGLGWPVYNSPNAVPQCKAYFTKIFEAITATQKGTYCNLFRLHLDPAWTNDPNKTATNGGGENDISRFSASRLSTYLESLYIPIAQDALAHGLYVIIRPPGVFPEDVTVGDAYNNYLMTVWDLVSKNAWVKAHPGQVMLELGNEPVRMSGALADYFQPIVNKIRQNGFTGILLLPGTAYQADYTSYNTKAIQDNNFGYAVHNYPGWYGGWDANQTEAKYIAEFESKVPVDKKPIVITEVDWSPMKQGAGHWNETHTQYTEGNFGTWATGTTLGQTTGVPYQNTQNIGWGTRFKHLVDKHPNISFTLQGTTTYVDMDKYLKNGTVEPAFLDAMKAAGYPNADQACSGACFQWFKTWAGGDRVPMPKGGFGPVVTGNAKYDNELKRCYFYTPTYSSFTFSQFAGKQLDKCAEFIIELGTSTVGYRLDVQLKDRDGNIIKDGTNDFIIGTEARGTRLSEPETKVFELYDILSDYAVQYPGCTIGDIRINTAISQEDTDKRGLYYISIDKMELTEGQMTATPGGKNLAELPLMKHTDELVYLVNNTAENESDNIGGWGGTIVKKNGVGTFTSAAYELTNTATNPWESQVNFQGNYAKGQTYTLKMNVKGAVAGTISAAFQKSDGYEGRGDFPTMNVTKGYTEVKVSCTVTDDGCDRLLINYGGFPGTLWLDNIEITTTESKGTEITGNNIRLNSSVEAGAEIYGAGLGGTVTPEDWVDLTGYKKIIIKGTGGDLRVLYNRPASGTTPELNPSLSSGKAVIDISEYPAFHLNSIKNGWGQPVANISSITLVNSEDGNQFVDYIITGKGKKTKSVIDALADVKAVGIDVTTISNRNPWHVVPANPNCLVFYADDDKVDFSFSNPDRNLVLDSPWGYSSFRTDLYDGYDFFAPVGFDTMGGASFTRELTDDYATVVLPFELDVNATTTADVFLMKEFSKDGNLVFEKVKEATLPAGTAILYRKKSVDDVVVLNGKNIVQSQDGIVITPINNNGWFTAYATRRTVIDDVTKDAVLKKYDVYGISKGKFVHATKKVTTNPFRAFYLVEKSAGVALTSIGISIDEDEETSIDDAPSVNGNTIDGESYDALGIKKNNVSSGINIMKQTNGQYIKVNK